MKDIFLVLLVVGFSSIDFAQAENNPNPGPWMDYGYSLCENVSFRQSSMEACKADVQNRYMSHLNVYSFALNICVGHNRGSSGRIVSCFEKAATHMRGKSREDALDAIYSCKDQYTNYTPIAECIHNRFSRLLTNSVQSEISDNGSTQRTSSTQ